MSNYFKKKNVLLLLIFAMSAICGITTTFAVETDYFEQPITMSFNQSELGTVLKKISEMSGIKIIYDEKISQKSVSGIYEEVPLRIVVHRLLKGTSNSLTFDEKKKILLIEGFGQARYVTTETGSERVDFVDTALTYAELNALHAEQLNEFEQEQVNKNIFLEEFGMTLGEMESMHEEQLANFNQEQGDASTILPEFGMTVGEHQSMVEEQLSEFNNGLDNGNTMSSEFGMTSKEHRVTVEKQLVVFNQNEDEFLPEFGMTRGKLKQQYSQQMKSFKESLTQR
jgi:hypothetical protein